MTPRERIEESLAHRSTFPFEIKVTEGSVISQGKTLLDDFAGIALSAMGNAVKRGYPPKEIAVECYEIARAMLKESEKQFTGEWKNPAPEEPKKDVPFSQFQRGYVSAINCIDSGEDPDALLNEAKAGFFGKEYTKGWIKACKDNL